MKRSPVKKVLILVSILAIPGFLFFYILPHFAKNRYKSLPIFGEKKVASTFHTVKGKQIPDTIYHLVPDFSLVNQSGKTLGWNDLQHKIVVINIFNPENTQQPANQYLKQLSDSYAMKPLVRFLSLSVAPVSVTALRAYANHMKVMDSKWDLLSGDTLSTYPLIRKGLLLDVIADKQPDTIQYIFSNKILLLDDQHRIRGIYDPEHQEDKSRLEDEIKVLIAEYLRNIKDGR